MVTSGKLMALPITTKKKLTPLLAKHLFLLDELKFFVNNFALNIDTLNQFVERISIDVGILVGRLQHDGIIKCSQFNNLIGL